jgi:hypothetical protein
VKAFEERRKASGWWVVSPAPRRVGRETNDIDQ